MKDNKSGWQFPKALEIIKCKEGNKEFMKERPARSPVRKHRAYLRISDRRHAAEEPNAKIDYMAACKARRAGLLARFPLCLRLSYRRRRMAGKPPSASTVNIKTHERSYSIMFSKEKDRMPRLRLSLHTGAGKHLHGGRTAFYGG
ncbi:MAG: hypothetical protein ACLR1P_07525 [Oscillospiraceae bacterium]